MANLQPELEVIARDTQSLRYLEHGWPDPLCRWHSHKECELHLIISTHGKAFVGDYIGDFGPRSLFLTGPHLPHNWITDDAYPEPVAERDMVIQFDQGRLEILLKAFPEFDGIVPMMEMAKSGIEFEVFDYDAVEKAFAQVRDQSGPTQILTFLSLLSQIARLPQKRALSVLQLYHGNRNVKQSRISEVVDHIVEHFGEELSVETAAKMAGMTAPTFSRNFQTVTGNRFVEFVNRVRIGQACGMLYATDDQVTSICYQVGFQNLANFNRHFLKMKGMTPSTYRETARNDLMPTEERAT